MTAEGQGAREDEETTAKRTETGLPAVPTNKILAIGSLPNSLTLDQQRAMRPKEVLATLRLYLQGKIDQWWYRQDAKGGVVFLVNAKSEEEARQILGQLPLNQARLLVFELIPLGPLAPLHVLLSEFDCRTAK